YRRPPVAHLENQVDEFELLGNELKRRAATPLAFRPSSRHRGRALFACRFCCCLRRGCWLHGSAGSIFPGPNLFFDSGCFAGALAQVIELGATHVTAALNGDFLYARRVDHEHALDTDALEYPTDSQRRVDATAMALDDDAFIALRAFFAAFL